MAIYFVFLYIQHQKKGTTKYKVQIIIGGVEPISIKTDVWTLNPVLYGKDLFL